MAHVELSLSDARASSDNPPRESGSGWPALDRRTGRTLDRHNRRRPGGDAHVESRAGVTAVDRWADTVQTASEPCLIVDELLVVIAMSRSACQLFGFPDQDAIVGRYLQDGFISLVDFTAGGATLADDELQRIPPMLAVTSKRLARGLMRVRSALGVVTMDAVSTPLLDELGVVIGSLTFFCVV